MAVQFTPQSLSQILFLLVRYWFVSRVIKCFSATVLCLSCSLLHHHSNRKSEEDIFYEKIFDFK